MNPGQAREAPTVRAYRPVEDREALRRCFVALQEHERQYDADLKPGSEVAEKYLAHLFSECAAHQGRIFVAELGGRIVGYAAVLGRALPDPLDSAPNPYAYLHDLVVEDAARGSGVGHALLERAEAFAKEQGATRIRLHVLSENRRAAEIYQAAGYRAYETLLEKALC